MKYLLTLSILLFTLASCHRDNPVPEPSLEGDWKMILYIDSVNNVTETKEQSYAHPNFYMSDVPYPPTGDVVMKIRFNSVGNDSGTIIGSTIKNGCSLEFLKSTEHHFVVTRGTWSLAADVPWGQYFATCTQTVQLYEFDEEQHLRLKAPGKVYVFSRL